MKITVSEIPEEGLDLEDEEPVEAETAGMAEKAKLRLNIRKAGSEVLLRGDIAAVLRLVCGRCLRDFKAEVSIPVDLAYHPVEELRVDERYELSPDELNTGFYKDDELDLLELTKEQVLLTVPMKPLCSDTCKGICPRCGKDLNEGPCGCDLKHTEGGLKMLDKFLKGRKE
jgi:uncharacterized protein